MELRLPWVAKAAETMLIRSAGALTAELACLSQLDLDRTENVDCALAQPDELEVCAGGIGRLANDGQRA